MNFGNLAAFATFTTEMIHKVDHAKHHALEETCVIIETEAKEVIGTYKYGWTPLAPSTLARKAADTPLLETGEMRDSISHEVNGDEAKVGSTSDIALYQELGTSRIPARSFLLGAANAKKDEIEKALGEHFVAKITT